VIYNPYEDFTTHKINQILAEGGFAPEWIMLKKEIETERQRLRDSIHQKCAETFSRQNLTRREKNEWNEFLAGLRDKPVKKLNATIDRFNLMVPMLNSQMFHFDLDREAEKIFQNWRQILPQAPAVSEARMEPTKVEEDKSNFLSELFREWFIRKS
jgi:DnaJ family protein C protein 28